MKLVALAAVAASLMLITPTVAAQAATATGSEAKADDSAKAEKKECRRLPVSGTRQTKRVCMTKDEWEKVEEEAKF